MNLITYLPMGIDEICPPCPNRDTCLTRLETSGEGWLYYDQLPICQTFGEPSYITDEDLIIRACCEEGPMSIPLTPEEEYTLLTHQEVGV